MDAMTGLQQGLVALDYSTDRPTVLGRDLHAALEVQTAYKDWFPRMAEYGFSEGTDFNPLKIERVQSEGSRVVSREVTDHQLTLSMAKELCMLQRTEKGKQCRQYFIELESKWNSPEMVMARALQISDRKVKELESGVREMKPKADYYDALVAREHLTNLRDTAKMLGIGERTLVKKLMEDGYLYRDKHGKLVPYAERNFGYFAVKEFYDERKGYTGLQTLVTVKGRERLLHMSKCMALAIS